MKTLLLVAILAVAGTSYLRAQEAESLGRGHLLAGRQTSFLLALQEGEIEKAYEGLFKHSRRPDKEAVRDALAKETDRMLARHGDVTDWDNHGIVRQEKHQALGSAILCFDHQPVTFHFMWYRKTDRSPWMLLDAWFSDREREYRELEK